MFGDIFNFEKSAMGDRLDLLKKDPWRAPLGLMDQGSTNIFNTLTGKDLEPMVDYYGGTTKQNVANAKAKGIDTGPGEGMHNIARAITSLFAGGYGADKLGMFGGAQGGGSLVGSGADATTVPLSSAPSQGANWSQWAQLGSKGLQGFGKEEQKQAQVNPYAQALTGNYNNPPQSPQPGVLEQPDYKTQALIRALMNDSPEPQINSMFGGVDPMSPQADAIRERALQTYRQNWGR